MALKNIEVDLLSVLGAAGIGLTPGDGAAASPNLFRGPERPAGESSAIPSKAVFVTATGGIAPRPYMGSARTSFKANTAQVIVRSDPEAYAGAYTSGLALALEVYRVLHLAPLTGAFATYIRVAVREGAPVYLGRNTADCHRWTLNVELWYEE